MEQKIGIPIRRVSFALSFALTCTAAYADTTEFSMTGEQGSMMINSGGSLNSLSDLAGGSNEHFYNTQFFSPTVSDTYVIGTSMANFDTVLILYDGSFDPGTPATNAVQINDDSGGAQFTYGLTNVGSCSTDNWCSEVSYALVAGNTYTVVTSTYGDDIHLTGDVWYYVIGPAQVSVGTGVYDAASAMGNVPAYGAAIVIDGNTDLLALFDGLATDEELSAAATQTLPLLTGGSMVANDSALFGINRIIRERLDNAGMSSGDAPIGDGQFWLKPFGSWADQGDRNGVSGFDGETWGLALGADTAVSPATRLGLALAYANSRVDSNSSVAPHDLDVDLYRLIGYGSYSPGEDSELSFQLDAGVNSNRGRRTIAFTSTVAKSDYDGYGVHLGIGASHTYRFNEQSGITLALRADYTWMRDDSYSETGAGLLNLDVDSRDNEELILGLDGELAHRVSANSTLRANLGVGYDLLNERASVTSTFAGAPGASFVTHGITPDPWLGRAGLEFSHNAGDGMEIAARYDAEYRDDFLNQTASVKLSWVY